jgi:hypothetical protein
LLGAAKWQIRSVAPLYGGAPNDPPQAEPAGALEHNEGFGARQPNIEGPRREITFADPGFALMRLRNARSELGEARSLPPWQIVQDIEMYDRQSEPSSELSRQGRFPAAGAADNYDTLRRHSHLGRKTGRKTYPNAASTQLPPCKRCSAMLGEGLLRKIDLQSAHCRRRSRRASLETEGF